MSFLKDGLARLNRSHDAVATKEMSRIMIIGRYWIFKCHQLLGLKLLNLLQINLFIVCRSSEPQLRRKLRIISPDEMGYRRKIRI